MSFCHHISTVKCPNCAEPPKLWTTPPYFIYPNYDRETISGKTCTPPIDAKDCPKTKHFDIKIHKAENGWVVWMDSTGAPSVFAETDDVGDFIAGKLLVQL